MKNYKRLLKERIRKAVSEGSASLEQASREGRQWLRRMRARERIKASKLVEIETEEVEVVEAVVEEIPAEPKKRGRPKKGS